MSELYLTFKIDDQNRPTGELPDLVAADDLKPTSHLAVVLKPAEIVSRRQAFDTFVGCAVINGEIVYGWREAVDLPEMGEPGSRPVFGQDVPQCYPSMAVKAMVERSKSPRASKGPVVSAMAQLFDLDGANNG